MTFLPLGLLLFGVAIGATGIGGVALAPSLVAFAGLELSVAVPTALAAFLVTGLVGVVIFRRTLLVLAGASAKLAAAAFLGAAAGATAFPWIAGIWLEIVLGAMMCAVGALELTRSRSPPKSGLALGSARDRLVLVGALVGFGSAVTGTGGPVLLVPLMLLLGAHVRNVVALAQLVQIPISGAATLVNTVHLGMDLGSAVWIGAILGLGAVGGGLAAHRLPQQLLSALVACLLLIGGGAFIAIRLS